MKTDFLSAEHVVDCVRFRGAQSTYHVRIVPVSGGRVSRDHVLIVAVVVDYALHASPRVLDVVEVPPQVAPLRYGRVVWLKKRNENKKTRIIRPFYANTWRSAIYAERRRPSFFFSLRVPFVAAG